MEVKQYSKGAMISLLEILMDIMEEPGKWQAR